MNLSWINLFCLVAIVAVYALNTLAEEPGASPEKTPPLPEWQQKLLDRAQGLAGKHEPPQMPHLPDRLDEPVDGLMLRDDFCRYLPHLRGAATMVIADGRFSPAQREAFVWTLGRDAK